MSNGPGDRSKDSIEGSDSIEAGGGEKYVFSYEKKDKEEGSVGLSLAGIDFEEWKLLITGKLQREKAK